MRRKGDRYEGLGFTLAIVASTVFSVLAGCSASYPTAPEPTVAAVRIHVASTVWDLVPNSTAQFIAYAIDSDGAYTNVTSQASWSTSDSSVLSVSANQSARVVRGVSAGDANVMVSFSGQTDSVTLRVHPAPRSAPRIELEGSSVLPAITPSRTQTVTLQIRTFPLTGVPQVVTSAASITTSDSNVAIADGAIIRPVSPGTFRIVATYNGLTATALSSVPPPQAPSR